MYNKGTTTPATLSVSKIWENVVSNANIITKGQMNRSLINLFLIKIFVCSVNTDTDKKNEI